MPDNPFAPTRQLLSIDETAEELGLCAATVRRAISDGRLPAYRVGKQQIRIKRADLDKMLTPIQPGHQ